MPHAFPLCPALALLSPAGEDDYRVCLTNGVIAKGEGIPCPLDDAGCFTDPVADFKGQYCKARRASLRCAVRCCAALRWAPRLDVQARCLRQPGVQRSVAQRPPAVMPLCASPARLMQPCPAHCPS